MSNPLAYVFSCIFVLLAHGAMLFSVFYNGSYDDVNAVIVLMAAVIQMAVFLTKFPFHLQGCPLLFLIASELLLDLQQALLMVFALPLP